MSLDLSHKETIKCPEVLTFLVSLGIQFARAPRKTSSRPPTQDPWVPWGHGQIHSSSKRFVLSKPIPLLNDMCCHAYCHTDKMSRARKEKMKLWEDMKKKKKRRKEEGRGNITGVATGRRRLERQATTISGITNPSKTPSCTTLPVALRLARVT